LEASCKVQLDVFSTGREICTPDHALATTMAKRYGPQGKLNLAPIEWPAMLRQLDKKDASYRT